MKVTKQLKWGRAFSGLTGVVLLASLAHAGADSQRLVGRQTDGRVVLTTNQQLNPSGTVIEFRGRPTAVAVHPNGKTAALLNGAYQALIVIDLDTQTVVQEFDGAGSSASFAGLLYSKDGTRLFASQASGKVIALDVAADGTLSLSAPLPALPLSQTVYPGREDQNPYPGGLALSEDQQLLFVALSRNNSLGVIDLQNNTFVREIAVGNAPHSVVVSAGKVYVSNQGGRAAMPDDFTVGSSGTRIVADTKSGFASTGTISVIDLNRIAGDGDPEVKTIDVGLAPTALLSQGRFVYVANTNSDTVSQIDTTRDSVVKTIATRPFPGAAMGSSPNGLAMTPRGQLVVSLGRNNALAVYDVGHRPFEAARLLGLIPTGWYPSDVAVDVKHSTLIVANGKGLGSLGPEATVGPDPDTNRTGKWVHSNLGSASIVALPGRQKLFQMTQQVYTNNQWDKLAARMRGGHAFRPSKRVVPKPIPAELGDPSVFKHVFYIIKENRTYDQVFGDLSQANGDPNLVQFGRDVTPNHHALAEQFVLLDNLYDCGSNSADGHQWATQAIVVDYLEKAFGGFTRSYPFNGGDSLAYSRTRFLWDNALRQGKAVRVYGEYVNGLRADGVEMGPWTGTFLGHGETSAGTWSDFFQDAQLLAQARDSEIHVKLEAHTEIPSLSSIIDTDYPPYNQIIPDQYRAEVFLREFDAYVKNGNLPNLVMMALTNDHTEGTTPGYPTPRAMVADNDLALGRIVDAISHSRYWKDSVIFVVEDDAQNGVDHVDGHRTIGLVISPYTKRRIVDSNYYTQLHMIRSMEQILGLHPMNQMDMAVDPTEMARLFSRHRDLTPYHALDNTIALDELNPEPTALQSLEKQWAIASAQMDFSQPDAADEAMLNRVIWYSATGFQRPYPGDASLLSPDQVAKLD